MVGVVPLADDFVLVCLDVVPFVVDFALDGFGVVPLAVDFVFVYFALVPLVVDFVLVCFAAVLVFWSVRHECIVTWYGNQLDILGTESDCCRPKLLKWKWILTFCDNWHQTLE